MNHTITLQRDNIGRFSSRNILVRFLYWLVKLPIKLLAFIVNMLYTVLAAILPSRKTARKILWYQVIVLSLLMNLFLAHANYVVRCNANGAISDAVVVKGWFMRRQECGEVAEAFAKQHEVAIQEAMSQSLINNPDLAN